MQQGAGKETGKVSKKDQKANKRDSEKKKKTKR
jgi:hypothetical protein